MLDAFIFFVRSYQHVFLIFLKTILLSKSEISDLFIGKTTYVIGKVTKDCIYIKHCGYFEFL